MSPTQPVGLPSRISVTHLVPVAHVISYNNCTHLASIIVATAVRHDNHNSSHPHRGEEGEGAKWKRTDNVNALHCNYDSSASNNLSWHNLCKVYCKVNWRQRVGASYLARVNAVARVASFFILHETSQAEHVAHHLRTLTCPTQQWINHHLWLNVAQLLFIVVILKTE